MESKTFPGILDSLDPIRQHIKELSNQAGLDKKSTYNLMLAADEIATNIILYGYEQAGQSGNIEVLSEIADNQLKIVFEDEAVPFDPTARDLPDADDFSIPLEERQIGGMGIFLTINGVDQFLYEYANNRNRNIFIMNVDHAKP